MTEQEICANCGHAEFEHFKPEGCQHVMGRTTHYFCLCKKFKPVLMEQDKKGKKAIKIRRIKNG